MKRFATLGLAIPILVGSLAAPGPSRAGEPEEVRRARLLDLAEELSLRDEAARRRVAAAVRSFGWPRELELFRGGVAVLVDVEDGRPVYLAPLNAQAAIGIEADHVLPGGDLGLDLDGSGQVLGLWDADVPRATHEQLVGRITPMQFIPPASYHATPMACTMLGSGTGDASARGMAPAATLRAWSSTSDATEMTTEQATADPVGVSLHPYALQAGWDFVRPGCTTPNFQLAWLGETTVSTDEDADFGLYGSRAVAWDQLTAAAPTYLPVTSAGNDRANNDQGSTSHCHFTSGGFVLASDSHPADGGALGYDSIAAGQAVAKNALTVGAVEDLPSGWSNPSDVVALFYSGFGPTDDGRIKPDLVTPSEQVHTAAATGDAAYTTFAGTSTAAAIAAGALALLRQHFEDELGSTPLAATSKALVLHTASQAGDAPGPDYRHGWGLLNVAAAVAQITDTGLSPPSVDRILEETIADGATWERTVRTDGAAPLRVTIAWTDPAGPQQAASALDDRTPRLRNDLDLELIDPSGSSHLPWVLDPDDPDAAPARADNDTDNVEQVVVEMPDAGEWTLRVTVDGSLVAADQDFSAIVEGTVEAFDLGDAPTAAQSGFAASYPTTLADGGARHGDGGRSLRLGTDWDSEDDGQPNSSATGDDLSANDEDGITLLGEWVVGRTTTLEVVISGGAGTLDGWVDWNRDGDWADVGEAILADETLVEGVHELEVAVPADADGPPTFARFRLSTAGSALPGGDADDGEVEDLRTPWILLPPSLDVVAVPVSPDASVGVPFSWTITAANALGVATAHDAVLTATVPAGSSFAAGSSDPGWACAMGGDAGDICTFGPFDLPGEGETSALWSIVATDPADAGRETLQLAVEVDAADADLATHDSSVLLDAAPDLWIAAEPDVTVVRPGGTVVWAVSFGNRAFTRRGSEPLGGDQVAGGVEVVETVPAGGVFRADLSTPGWSCPPDSGAGTACVHSAGDLAPGDERAVDFAVEVFDQGRGEEPPPEIGHSALVRDDGTSGPDGHPGDESVGGSVPIDAILPTIVDVRTPSLEEASLLACTTLRAPFREWTMELDEPVSGAFDVEAWKLVESGPDGVLQTEACSDPEPGDDVLRAIEIVDAERGEDLSSEVVLRTPGSLPRGPLRLLACTDRLADLAGNPLDGTGSGSPSDFVLEIRADPFDLFENAHLDDCPAALDPWVPVGTAPVGLGSPGTDDADGAPGSTSIRVEAGSAATGVAQCVHFGSEVVLGLRVEARAEVPSELSLRCAQYAAEDCLGVPSIVDQARASLSAGSTFSPFAADFPRAVGSTSALCEVTASLPQAESGTVWLDAFFLGDDGSLFADGFESGDASAWN